MMGEMDYCKCCGEYVFFQAWTKEWEVKKCLDCIDEECECRED